MSLYIGILASQGSGGALLDSYGGAAAAFSLRKLSSTYGGAAVRVRRSLDNAEQDIQFAGGQLDQAALQAFVGYENAFTYSEQFDIPAWNKLTSTITPNAGTDPFGGNNADRWLSNSNSHALYQSFALTVGQSYTISFYVKSNTGLNQLFRLFAFGTILSSDLTATTGWQRFTFTFVAISSANQDHGIARPSTNAANDLLIFGAQINQGVTAQNYQQTVATANTANGFVTRWYTQDGNGENLLLQSNSFTVSPWTSGNGGTGVLPVITANAATDPFGGSTATRVVFNTGGGTTGSDFSFLIQSVTAGTSRNYSIWMKSFSGANQTISINVGGGILGATFTVTSSWQRFSFNYVPSGNRLQLVLAGTDGSSTSDILIYGAQISNGTWLQGYQATTTTAVSRRDASQATAASQPRIVNAGVIERLNGKPAIYHTPSQSLGFTSLALGTTYSLFPIVDFRILGKAVIGNSASPTSYGIYTDGTGTSHSPSFAIYSLTSSVAGLDPVALSISRNGTTAVNVYDNGIQYTMSALPSNASFVVNNLSGDGSSANLDGYLAEVPIYPTSQSNSILNISQNQNSYYQLFWQGTQQALLDQFGGSAAAFSLRNLSSSYRGPLVRVRRSSDNAETDIGGTFSGDLDVNSLLAFTGGQNLVTNSDDFSAASWAKGATTITTNVTIAPDGTLTADKISETAVNSSHFVSLSTGIMTTTQFYTLSFYAKAAERSWVVVYFYDGVTSRPASFNLSTGITGTVPVGYNASIQSAGNGWYRCSVSATVIGGAVTNGGILTATGDNQFSYLGVAGSGVYVWGAQLTTGSVLQPYIPTTTAAINGANAFVTKWYDQSGIGDNLVLQSETFGNASWSKNQCTVSENVGTDPFGGNNADKILELGGTAQNPYVSQSISLVAGTTYVISCYIKAAERNFAIVYLSYLGAEASQLIDLTTGSVAFNINNPQYTIENAGNGWWRLAIFYTPTTLSGTGAVLVAPKLTTAYGTYNTTLNSGILIFGFQVSASSQLLRYQPTTTAIAPKRDAVQTTAASQPRIVNAGSVESENGKPSIFFDGTDDRLATSAAVITSTSFSTFSVFSSTSAVNGVISSQHNAIADFNRTVFLGSDSSLVGTGYIFYAGPSSTYQINTTSSDVFNGTDSIVFTASNNGLMSIGFRGVLQNTLSAPAWTPLNAPLSIGATGGATPTAYITARIQELGFYPTYQTAYQSISSNMNTYYGSYWQGNGTALLDSFSGASAAYSLRNLSSAYTGPLIRVRRSSDNAERDIFGTFRGDLDLAALTSFVGANSGFVTTWYDQSGTGRHATQATAASQPRIVNAGAVDTLGGKPSLIFDGTNDFMSFADLTAPQFTSFYPQKKDANADISAWFTQSVTADLPISPVIFGTFGIYIGSGSSGYNNATYQNINYILMSGYMNSANVGFIQINNANVSLSSFSPTIPSSTFNRINARPTGSSYSKVSTPEMIMYAFDNSANISAINNSINNYYKIY